MRGQAGFFDVEERLKQLSAKGDSLERLSAVVDFERFRADLERAVVRSDRSRGGRPPFDHVLMFKVLILQSSHNLSDERTEYLIRDRLSFMRFLGLGLADTVPDANTIWGFREALTRARIAGRPAIEVVFERFDAVLATAGFLAMSGQIIDASIIAAPKQRNTDGEKHDIKQGRIPPAWADKPAKLPEKGPRWALDGQVHKGQTERRRCTACRSRGPGLRLQKPRRHRPPASPDPPLDGHRCGAPRRRAAARAGRPEPLPAMSGPTPLTAQRPMRSSSPAAFCAHRSTAKSRGKPMPRRTARANARKSGVREAVEHVFARQKGPMGLFIRTIGLARATTKIGLANLLYNMQRMVWLTRQIAPA